MYYWRSEGVRYEEVHIPSTLGMKARNGSCSSCIFKNHVDIIVSRGLGLCPRGWDGRWWGGCHCMRGFKPP